MKPARDPSIDYHAFVAGGYDACAAAYNAARSAESADVLQPLLDRLTEGARVLDLGCGAGVPIARTLARTCDVTGVDISPVQIALARAHVPEARFIAGDMVACDFAAESFDAVVSFYAIFHLPREEHAALFARIHRWLAPGGCLLATIGLRDDGSYTEDGFFGVEMYWSNYGVDEYRVMLSKAGFDLLSDTMLSHGYDGDGCKGEAHPLVLARKR